MASTLKDKKVLVVGRGSGLARAITQAASAAGATVTAAGRHAEELADAYDHDPGVSAESVDLTDDDSIAGLARRVGAVDHVVSTASARARGMIGDLERDAVRRSFDTKVIGPLMLARAFRGQINDGGSIVIFSGVAAFDIEPGTLAVADHQRRGGHPHPVAGRRARTDPRQCDLPRRDRHRRLGCARRGRQGEAVRREARAKPGAADRRARGHR
jgi:NAD(P)-dependent dehydrogenase (short-subunit alcohol dehydrogenase family)